MGFARDGDDDSEDGEEVELAESDGFTLGSVGAANSPPGGQKVQGWGLMINRPSRHSSGDDATDQKLIELIDHLDVENNRDQIFDILATVTKMARDDLVRLDLKITNTAIAEMLEAFRIFEPYAKSPKVTMFGSARTSPDDPLYEHAKTCARELAEQGWMVVTGAGPGIMAAGMEGAGRDMSMGINIRLPFEQSANEFINADPKLVTMKYFFTRKLMLIKESDGFVVMPGGYGTLDEAFELLTLIQTGKAEPTPIVLLDVPGSTYWERWRAFIDEEVEARGLISKGDQVLFKITDSVQEATDEILDFYRNYHSRRFVGDRLVIRLRHKPSDADLAKLSEEFADICKTGAIEHAEPARSEIETNDELDKHRISLRFDRMRHARMRQFINALNALDSAPDEQQPPRHYNEPPID